MDFLSQERAFSPTARALQHFGYTDPDEHVTLRADLVPRSHLELAMHSSGQMETGPCGWQIPPRTKLELREVSDLKTRCAYRGTGKRAVLMKVLKSVYAAATDINEDPRYLDGQAIRMFFACCDVDTEERIREIPMSIRCSWKEFVNALLRKFTSERPLSFAAETLALFPWIGEKTIREHNAPIRERLRLMTESEKNTLNAALVIYRYGEALPSELAEEVSRLLRQGDDRGTLHELTLSGVMELLESRYFTSRRKETPDRPHKKGEKKRAIPSKKERLRKSDKQMEKTTCYNCREKGHYAVECTRPVVERKIFGRRQKEEIREKGLN